LVFPGSKKEVFVVSKYLKIIMVILITLFIMSNYVFGLSGAFKDNIYNQGKLKPIDSTVKIKVGEKVPDFILPSVSGDKISLSQFKGKKHVVISFVPAAWTPVCSDQWPG
jgi:cytochrome oxidase Cu insertion factor (SCO1/SenC/PrrC family)